VGTHEAYIFLSQFGDQVIVKHPVLLVDQSVDLLADLGHHFRCREIVRVGVHRTRGDLLLQASDTDFEKLVQVGAGNTRELEPLWEAVGFGRS
jgi:hypothetical protein